MKAAEEILRLIDGRQADDGHETHEVIDAMKEYAKQACEEQRRLCLQNWIDYSIEGCLSETVERDFILNAPLPELK